MRTISTTKALLFAAVVFVAASPADAGAQDAQEIFERLKAKYASGSAVRAEFSQTMTSAYTDEEATTEGRLVVQGDRYRVETEGQTLVTDGKVTWVYVPSQNQVLINDSVEDEGTFSLSEFFFDYDKRFDVSGVASEMINGDRHHVLTLTPREDDSFFTEATLSIRDRDDIVTGLRVVDVNGTTMVFKLKNVQINPSLEKGVFTFTPPTGAEVIDLRS